MAGTSTALEGLAQRLAGVEHCGADTTPDRAASCSRYDVAL